MTLAASFFAREPILANEEGPKTCNARSKHVSRHAVERARMRQISGEGGRRGREKKAAGKEAQGAVKCRTRKKDGRTAGEGCLCVPSEASLGRSVGRSVARAIRKGEVKGGREGDVLKGCLHRGRAEK